MNARVHLIEELLAALDKELAELEDDVEGLARGDGSIRLTFYDDPNPGDKQVQEFRTKAELFEYLMPASTALYEALKDLRQEFDE